MKNEKIDVIGISGTLSERIEFPLRGSSGGYL
jgi:hypothetical protein